MRNVFDQYSQPENRLTHALGTLLHEDSQALHAFLKLAGATPPKGKALIVCEQSLPGMDTDSAGDERLGLPDLWIHDKSESWCLLVECKGEGRVGFDQMRRHQRTAERRGFERIDLLALTTQVSTDNLPAGTARLTWSAIYAWATGHPDSLGWAKRFTQFLEIAERKMADDNYLKNGTLTTFTGIPFNDATPYSYGEAKRVMRLMGERLRQSEDLKALGVDASIPGRKSITGKTGDLVWDYLTLASADQDKAFTNNPHLTMALERKDCRAHITVPSGMSQVVRRRLTEQGQDSFLELLSECYQNLRENLPVEERLAVPHLYILQRHYKSQSSPATRDGKLDIDLRVLVKGGEDKTKFQPQWGDAAYSLMSKKASNM